MPVLVGGMSVSLKKKKKIENKKKKKFVKKKKTKKKKKKKKLVDIFLNMIKMLLTRWAAK